jgi:pyrophosphate--fructose-6-phosphate 1-phosphotransferase
VYVPEAEIDIDEEAHRLVSVMQTVGNVNIFLSEGAGVETIVKEMEEAGERVPRDAFGHVQLDHINPGLWFARQFASMIGAEKVMVQKSGYYSRSAPANDFDLALIKTTVDMAVDCALAGVSGLIGQDEQAGNVMQPIALTRIAGAKPFDTSQGWFTQMLGEIGQPAQARP